MQMQYNFACVLNNTKKKSSLRVTFCLLFLPIFFFLLLFILFCPQLVKYTVLIKIPRQNIPFQTSEFALHFQFNYSNYCSVSEKANKCIIIFPNSNHSSQINTDITQKKNNTYQQVFQQTIMYQ